MTTSPAKTRVLEIGRALAAAAAVAVVMTAAARSLQAVELVAQFDAVTVVANPDNWTIIDIDLTVDGSTAGNPFPRIVTGASNDATGVVIDYTFTTPRDLVTRLELFNNGGNFLTDRDGIGTALVEVFDASDALLFSGMLNAGNGGAAFQTVFPAPLNNVSRVRLSNITNLLGHAAPDIIWRELWAIQDFNPDVTLEKTGSGPDPLNTNDTITYSFLVTNTGDTPLTNVTVTDPLPDLSPISCPGTTLAVGASMTCTATYTVTVADADAGFVSNTATVVATPPGGLPDVSAEDTAIIPPSQVRAISLEKTGSGPSPLSPGDTVTFTFEIRNTGNVTLSGIAVIDTLPGMSPIDCPATTLAGGASMTCSATYVVTTNDAATGQIENAASVTGLPPTGSAVSDADATILAVGTAVPALRLPMLIALMLLLSAAVLRQLRRRRA